ncbi:FAD:protein FMN transferase [Gilvimarinus sp. F26214L]|uniref:FAD:protein FMN transferase n=1 Tax=Gilvimarinus sp. DZF01 TaxID=3461371 RepID=UPI004045904B
MGTSYHVTVVTERGTELPPGLGDSIDDWLAEVNESMSTYLPDSELSRLNRGPQNEWLPVSPMLMEVLKEAQRISHLSGGAFDITVGPLVDLWGFGPVDTNGQVPSDEALARVRAQVGYEHLELRDEPPAIRKTAPISLDLSAIAKGYGADYVGRKLQELGLGNHLVEVGGDLLVNGHNQYGETWKIGVERPAFETEGVQQALSLERGGVATSGDYRNFFQQGGQIYSHILDPRVGRPVRQNLASVTVVAETAARADGLATAFSVLGAEEGLEVAADEDIALYLIIRRGDDFLTRQSDAFGNYVESKDAE